MAELQVHVIDHYIYSIEHEISLCSCGKILVEPATVGAYIDFFKHSSKAVCFLDYG